MIQRAADLVYKYFLFFLPQGHSHPWDYAAHFIVSFAAMSALFFILRTLKVSYGASFITAVCILFVFAAAKEISDAQLGKTDLAQDMLANFLGISAATVLILLLAKQPN
ncbi:MAG: hypothetical protein HYS15_01520 [Candidatus Spechtbacteria bacterium]|nr:hypothetical protein [Candidatus Spechtbacteria bacterium]